MKLFNSEGNHLERIQSNPFVLEKDIQSLVEKNTESLFGLEFVKSEMKVESFRLDSLCYDKESKAFVIIEYKKDKNFSVIDQGYTYLSLLLNNKAEFILEYNESKEDNLKRDDIDWSQSRIIFVSPKYTAYQKHSVNFKDVPFELWEILRYQNGTIGMVKHEADSIESIETTSSKKESSRITSVTKEVRVFNEDYHLNKSKNRPQEIIDLYYKLKERVMDLGDDIELKALAQTIQFKTTRSIVDLIIYDKSVIAVINLKKGELEDPRGITEDISQKGHWGNGDYRIYIKPEDDIEYPLYLIKQSYEAVCSQ